MSTYYNAGGGCIDGDCTVVTVDGDVKCVKDIKRGDVVECVGGTWATVVCVVKTVFKHNRVDVVRINGGLTLTPFHPITINGTWKYPLQLSPVVTIEKDVVYDFVLDNEHVIVVNGVGCVTLGHGLVGDVVSHPFFGSVRVLEDLKKMRGWREGMVLLEAGGSFVRSEKTGLVCALKEQTLVY
eukprot:TRINITY_DN295_c0_g1_i1.p1 TRINITY_DN295_c0_g1~~TRINITY_DN295_c0_g1_i1.p1  ORF type:complete len:183 (+),score=53.70 TRINITY_DN295_c0_g1_i1:576-1124(+)